MADYYTPSVDTLVRKFKGLQDEIKKSNARLNRLREMRKKYAGDLLNFYDRNGLDAFEGISKSKLETFGRLRSGATPADFFKNPPKREESYTALVIPAILLPKRFSFVL